MSKVISANRLDDGTVAYLAANGSWVGSLTAAELFAGEAEAAAGLAEAQRAVRGNLVVEPIIVAVSESQAGPRPLSLRDRIRATGPTVKSASAADFARS